MCLGRSRLAFESSLAQVLPVEDPMFILGSRRSPAGRLFRLWRGCDGARTTVIASKFPRPKSNPGAPYLLVRFHVFSVSCPIQPANFFLRSLAFRSRLKLHAFSFQSRTYFLPSNIARHSSSLHQPQRHQITSANSSYLLSSTTFRHLLW